MGVSQKKGWLFFLFSIFLSFFPVLSFPSDAKLYTVAPRPVETPQGVITIQEFFWYSCPHCYQMESTFAHWRKTLPKDVKIELIPAVSNIYWNKMAVLYYALQELGKVDQLHEQIFKAQHVDQLNLYDPEVLRAFLAARGISQSVYEKASNSFGVAMKVKRSENLVKSYSIDAVPVFVINGTYIVSAETTGSDENLFAVMDQVIQMVRERTKKNGG